MRQQQFFGFRFQVVISQHPTSPFLTRPFFAGLPKPLALVGKQSQRRLIQNRSPQGFRRPFSFLQGIAQLRAAAHIAELRFQFLQTGRVFAGVVDCPLDIRPPSLQGQQAFLRHRFLFGARGEVEHLQISLLQSHDLFRSFVFSLGHRPERLAQPRTHPAGSANFVKQRPELIPKLSRRINRQQPVQPGRIRAGRLFQCFLPNFVHHFLFRHIFHQAKFRIHPGFGGMLP